MDSNIKSLLEQYGQQHLLQFWDELDQDERNQLLLDINSIDFEMIDRLKRIYIDKSETELGTENGSSGCLVEPLPTHVKGSKIDSTKETLDQYQELTLEAIRKGQVAALLLAGGQGTRLGFNHPKGMIDVGLDSHKTLYQMQAERILKLESMAAGDSGKCKIAWYIMTSEATKSDTEQFLKTNTYFGLDSDQVVIFEQNTLPCFTLQGKIILDRKHRISRAPDGNGGLYNALERCGILDDMQSRKIEYIHVYCVDNILVKVCDPIFLGYCISRQVTAGAKVVRKVSPGESVGVICKTGYHFKVIEYSELSCEMSEMRDDSGRLVYDAGNICDHFFKLNFLQELAFKQLCHHIAVKKIPSVDEKGNRVQPSAPNGIKLEKFIFDSFQFAKADNFAVWEVDRAAEFSPIKNATGPGIKDTPESGRQALLEAAKFDVILQSSL